MYYDENKDLSELSGWKKWKDEKQASEEEQTRWGWYSLFISISSGLVLVIIN